MQKGFTLIELIIVLLLTSIVAAITVSRFSSTSVFQQRTVFDQTQFLMKMGQKIAITQRRTIYISTAPQEIRLCYTNIIPCTDNQSVSAQGIPLVAKTQNLTITIPLGLSFNSQGFASNTLITIPVGGKNLFIEGGTGYVHD